MNTASDLGQFLVQKRTEHNISARWLAKALNISAVYICDIEKGRRALPDDLLPKVAEILLLTEKEKTQMYDLVAMSKNTVSVDICEYIMNKDIVRKVIRTAIKNDIPDDAWEAFFEQTIVQDKK